VKSGFLQSPSELKIQIHHIERKQEMIRKTNNILMLTGITSIVFVFLSCVTVNNLDLYSFHRKTMYVGLRTPPPATISTNYNVYIDGDNPIRTVLSIGTNIAKASTTAEAAEKLDAALKFVDIPGITQSRIGNDIPALLGCDITHSPAEADYFLDVEIEEYGISSYSSGVSYIIDVTITIFEQKQRKKVWRRNIDLEKEVSPSLFGMDSIIDNIITIDILADLSEEEMARGLELLARDAGKEVLRKLENDYIKAFYD
jgi:hypothetical protein